VSTATATGAISAQTVKDLRDRTGAGMMDCKKALAETGGDLDAAIAYLREKGLAGASKKAGRVTADGLVDCFAAADGTGAVVVELNCETDFVAKNDQFKSLLSEIGAALLSQTGSAEGSGDDVGSIKLGGRTISEAVKAAIASIGENVALRRFARLRTSGGAIGSYVHAGGKIGVLVEVSGATAADDELLKSLAMQVAAAFPRYVRRDEVDPAEVAREREIFRGQAANTGKPAQVIEKIVDGKIDKFYRDVCLLEQEYVRDPQVTIDKLLAQASKESGRKLVVERFVRYQLGEGIEKRSENIAEAVAQIAKGS
jgi:elongation factor Ts